MYKFAAILHCSIASQGACSHSLLPCSFMAQKIRNATFMVYLSLKNQTVMKAAYEQCRLVRFAAFLLQQFNVCMILYVK